MFRWLGLFLLLLIEGSIVVFLYISREEKEHQLSDRNLHSLQMAYQAALQTRDTAMRLAVQEVVLRHDVLAAFAEGIWSQDASEQAKMRAKLYRMLLPTYERLAAENVSQFQFHTKEGLSYLRFHQPDQFGDDLSVQRTSIAKMIEAEKPIKGFEVGSMSGSFRFIYPVFFADQRLGSVEIALSFKALRESMTQLAPNYEYELLTYERAAARAMSASQRAKYQPAQLNSSYLVETDESVASGAFVKLQQRLKTNDKIQRAMRDQRAVATYAWVDGNWYSIGLLPIQDTDNKPIAYIVSAALSPEIASIQRDFWLGSLVTGLFALILAVFLWRVQREILLRTGQQRQMQNISDAMADGLYVTDHEGKVTFANLATLSLLGYEQKMLIGCAAREVFYINDHGERGIDANLCPLCRVLRTGEPFRGEWRFIRQDDRIFDVEVASQPIIELGRLVGAVTVFRDVSDRNAVRQELIAAKALAEQASASKSAFLANMSHEIRTPMNGVLGMADLLQETTLNDEQADYVQTIRSSGDALLTVIDDILDYSKIEAGMMVIESAPFDLRALFKDVHRLMQVRADQKGLLLSLRVTDAVPAFVLGDSVRVRQVLLNLIGNAIKFTEQGSVDVLALLTQQEGDLSTIRIEVSDTGIGIAEDKINRLFKSFSQVDDSTSRRFGGTGLGLSISKRLVALMQGEMGVNSVEGQGSVFWFTLLVQEAAGLQTNTIRATDAAAGLPMARILLVEDNLVNQKVASAMLGKLGYKPVVANNGKEALSCLSEQDFDLVFMDCQMPVMDGFEATRAIRAGAFGGHPNITVIALTANAMKEDQEACYAAGMTDYLSKPLQIPALIAMLKKYLVVTPEPTSEL
jgi:PAS domain S-box-containing protein